MNRRKLTWRIFLNPIITATSSRQKTPTWQKTKLICFDFGFEWNITTKKTKLVTLKQPVNEKPSSFPSGLLVWYRPVTSRRRAGKPFIYVLFRQVKYFITSVVASLRDWIFMLSFVQKRCSVISERANFVKEKTRHSVSAEDSVPAALENNSKLRGFSSSQVSWSCVILIPSQQDQIKKPRCNSYITICM